MASRTDWTVGLAGERWFPLHIHLHWFTFSAFLAAGVWRTGFPGWGWYALFLGVLLLATLIHEWGHAWAASQWALPLQRWILWPLGGLERPHHAGRSEQMVSLAFSGPMMNVLVAFCLGLLLEVAGRSLGWPQAVVLPISELAGTDVLWLLARLLFWTNLALALVNLLPARDLDGGWILQQWLVARCGKERAEAMIRHTTALSGLGLCLGAVLLPSDWEFLVPALLGLGLIVFLGGLPRPLGAGTACQEKDASLWQMAALDDSGYPLDASAREEELAESPSWWETHWEDFAAEHSSQEDHDLDLQVDEILARLHAQGMQSLSPEDIALLNRASRKYRRKMRQKRNWSASAD